jgi:hypothetical protein
VIKAANLMTRIEVDIESARRGSLTIGLEGYTAKLPKMARRGKAVEGFVNEQVEGVLALDGIFAEDCVRIVGKNVNMKKVVHHGEQTFVTVIAFSEEKEIDHSFEVVGQMKGGSVRAQGHVVLVFKPDSITEIIGRVRTVLLRSPRPSGD